MRDALSLSALPGVDTPSRLAPLTLALSLALGACSDPYADRPSTGSLPADSTPQGAPTATPRPAAGDARPAEPTPAPPSSGRRPAALSPAQLARAYARGVTNWDWRILPDRLAALRNLTVGPLSAELGDAIAAAKTDESLPRDRPSSQGTVAAVMVSGHGPSRRVVVVTRERETAGGAEPLHAATHRVYLGKARQMGDGWRMVDWRRAP